MFLRLPGRTYGLGQPIWVCHAHIADSKVFTRSLLAKVGLCFLPEIWFLDWLKCSNGTRKTDHILSLVFLPLTELAPSSRARLFRYYILCFCMLFSESCSIALYYKLNSTKELSKSSNISCFELQTVVCFPFLGGVIELGVTDKVS